MKHSNIFEKFCEKFLKNFSKIFEKFLKNLLRTTRYSIPKTISEHGEVLYGACVVLCGPVRCQCGPVRSCAVFSRTAAELSKFTELVYNWPILKHKSRKILRMKLRDLYQMIALILTSTLNTLLSGSARPIFRKYEFR